MKQRLEWHKIISNLQLPVLSDGSPTLFHRLNWHKSAIDLIICSPSIASNFTWLVINNSMGSNHYPILINYNSAIKSHYTLFSNSEWNIKHANWTQCYNLSNLLAKKVSLQEYNLQNVQSKYHIVANLINVAAESSIPKKA